MPDIDIAKKILKEKQATCVFVKGDLTTVLNERGIRPLMRLVEQGAHFEGYSVADKVVGKSAAFLYVLLKVKAVFAGVISIEALKVLDKVGIQVTYEISVERIINRKGDGFCPMETAVMKETDPLAAYEILKAKSV